MATKNEMGTGLPSGAPEPARGEKAGAGMLEEKERLIDNLSAKMPKFRQHFVKVLSNAIDVEEVKFAMYSIKFKSIDDLLNFANFFMFLYRRVDGAQDIEVEVYNDHAVVHFLGETP
jgi:hypothetical protein